MLCPRPSRWLVGRTPGDGDEGGRDAPALGLEPRGVGAGPGRIPLPGHGPVLPGDAVLFSVGFGELPERVGAVGAHIAQLEYLGFE